jgi:hypothetical protein
MRENKLTVRIKKPLAQVFAYSIDPNNSPKWVDSFVEEKIDTPEVQVGTLYTNINKEGQVGTYRVGQFETGKLFQLDSTTSKYHVKYTYTLISEGETEIEYFEWMDEGELDGPFTQEPLNKFKEILETEAA